MRRLLALIIGVLAVVWLSGAPARADTLSDCLAKHHACVTSEGRSLVSQGQQAQLEQQIGDDDIYLVVAASGSSGYDAAMRQIISTLGRREEGVRGRLPDSLLKHLGADNRGMLAPGAAANIATTVVGSTRQIRISSPRCRTSSATCSRRRRLPVHRPPRPVRPRIRCVMS